MTSFSPSSADAALRSGINAFLGQNSFANFPLSLLSGQLAFPPTQIPSTDVNTLDDYEEGTWTPVIGGSGGTSGQTYVSQVGAYVKIGKIVIVQAFVALSNKGTITTNVEIQGLPFTSENTANQFSAGNFFWDNLAVAFVFISARVNINATAMVLRGTTAAAASLVTLTTADIANTTVFTCSACYRAAA